jgi:hypothetical protein
MIKPLKSKGFLILEINIDVLTDSQVLWVMTSKWHYPVCFVMDISLSCEIRTELHIMYINFSL